MTLIQGKFNYRIRDEKDEKIYVMVFDYRNNPHSRQKIHDFIYSMMHREIRKKTG